MEPTRIVEFRENFAQGEKVLKELLQLRHAFSHEGAGGALLADKTGERVAKGLVAKFPAVNDVERVGGIEQLHSQARKLLEDFEPAYYAVVDAREYLKNVQQFLKEESANIHHATLEDNPVVTEAFCALVTQYARVLMFVTHTPAFQLQLSLILYYAMYKHMKNTAHPAYQDTAKWIQHLGDRSAATILYMELKDVFQVMTPAIKNINTLLMSQASPDALRRQTALSITLQPSLLAEPTNDLLRATLQLSESAHLWYLYAFFVAPAIADAPDGKGLDFVLTEDLVLPVAGDFTVPFHPELEALWATRKTRDSRVAKLISKQRKQIQDFPAKNMGPGLELHAQRRVYLAQELSQLNSLLHDTPFLICPKINVVLAGIALARKELFWYFRHRSPALGRARIPAENEIVAKLLSLIFSLSDVIMYNTGIIILYYSQYLANADLAAARSAAEQLNQVNDTMVSGKAQMIVQLLEKFKHYAGPLQEETELNDEAYQCVMDIRAAYDDLEYALSKHQDAPKTQRDALVTFRIIASHADLAQDPAMVLDKYGAMYDLWYFRDELSTVFDATLESPEYCSYITAYFYALAEMPRTTNASWPEERAIVGEYVVKTASEFCSAIGHKVVGLIRSLCRFKEAQDDQLLEKNGLESFFFENRDKAPKTFKVGKNYAPPIDPSSESRYDNRESLRSVNGLVMSLNKIVAALSKITDFPVFNMMFSPLQFVREAMVQFLVDVLRKYFREGGSEVIPNEPDQVRMTRPTVILKRIQSVFDIMGLVETQSTIGLEQIWRDVLLNEFYIEAIDKFGLSDPVPLTDLQPQGKAIETVVAFCAQFVSRMVNPAFAGTIVYSPQRKGFVSRSDQAFHAEEYFDVTELTALCTIIGPYGVKVIDMWLQKCIHARVMQVREILIENAGALDNLMCVYNRADATVEGLRRVKRLDAFMDQCVIIGIYLQLRKLFREGLNAAVADGAPYVHKTVHAMFNAYPRNVFLDGSTMAMDFLAADYGEDVGVADQALKWVLRGSFRDGDQNVWRMLPVMMAISMNFSWWQNATYQPSLEAHTNNAHLLYNTLNDLIVGFSSIFIPIGDMASVRAFFLQFLEIASTVLLRLLRAEKERPDKKSACDYGSMLIFLDKFVDSCPLLTRDALEECIPYTYIRNMRRDIYAKKDAL